MKGVPHYKKDGTEYKDKMHKHADGTVMSETKMSKTAVPLVHYKDLSKTAKVKTKRRK